MLTSTGKLIKVVDSVAFKWVELAIAFGFEGAAIERIKNENFHKSKDSAIKMFDEWLNQGMSGCSRHLPATWITLIQCLFDTELAELANALESGASYELASTTEMKSVMVSLIQVWHHLKKFPSLVHLFHPLVGIL